MTTSKPIPFRKPKHKADDLTSRLAKVLRAETVVVEGEVDITPQPMRFAPSHAA